MLNKKKCSIFTMLFMVTILISFTEMKVHAADIEQNKCYLENNLYIGDSFTVRLETGLDEHGINFSAVAEPGRTIEQMMEYSYPDIKPARIVLLGGINDFLIDNEKVNLDEEKEQKLVNIDSEIKLINLLSEKYKCPIYVQAVFPVSDIFIQSHPYVNNKEIETYNLMLKYYCINSENVYYIDARSGFINEDGNLKRYEDGLHLSWDDYEQWMTNLENEISYIEQQ